jgi:hypothetical protein
MATRIRIEKNPHIIGLDDLAPDEINLLAGLPATKLETMSLTRSLRGIRSSLAGLERRLRQVEAKFVTSPRRARD